MDTYQITKDAQTGEHAFHADVTIGSNRHGRCWARGTDIDDVRRRAFAEIHRLRSAQAGATVVERGEV